MSDQVNLLCQVDEYMQQLDNNKIPRLATDGKKYHDMQLVVQLPRHDLSSTYCRHLKNDNQMESFVEFCKTRDAEAMDIGNVVPSVHENTVGFHCTARTFLI